MSVIEVGPTSVELLASIIAIQQKFIAEPGSLQAFAQALEQCVGDSQSEFGFIGEIVRTRPGEPVLRLCATSGSLRNDSDRGCHSGSPAGNVELQELGDDVGEVIRSGKIVISSANDPSSQNGIASKGFPPMSSFLGLPLRACSGELIGVLGLANRHEGYDDTMAARHQMMCDALGVMIDAARQERHRRDVEGSLRASEARLRIFADHVTDGIFLQDAEARVVDVNRRACESLGYEPEELIGLFPTDFDSAIKPADVSVILERLTCGETVAFDTRHRRKDGFEFPVEVRIRPLSIDGKFHTIALACDITERKQAEQKLKESQARLQLALAASRMGVWEWDILSGDVFWSPECYEIFRVAIVRWTRGIVSQTGASRRHCLPERPGRVCDPRRHFFDLGIPHRYFRR